MGDLIWPAGADILERFFVHWKPANRGRRALGARVGVGRSNWCRWMQVVNDVSSRDLYGYSVGFKISLEAGHRLINISRIERREVPGIGVCQLSQHLRRCLPREEAPAFSVTILESGRIAGDQLPIRNSVR